MAERLPDKITQSLSDLIEDFEQDIVEPLDMDYQEIERVGKVNNDEQAKAGHPRFHELLKEIGELHDKKNTDYAKGMREGPLGNFYRVSAIMCLYPGMDWNSPVGVALCYALKQFDAALTLRSTKRKSITGEPFAARLKDDAVYKLLAIIMEEGEPE